MAILGLTEILRVVWETVSLQGDPPPHSPYGSAFICDTVNKVY